MQTRIYSGEFLNFTDTLTCGQVFRYRPFKEGYLVFSAEKAAYVFNKDGNAYIQSEDTDYFEEYFDLNFDYKKAYLSAINTGIPFLINAAESGKGIRMLKQDKEEMIYSFIVSQNNNIPRITGIIERLCAALGEEKEFMGVKWNTFPKTQVLKEQNEAFFKGLGFGYRDKFMCSVSNTLKIEDIKKWENYDTQTLKKTLLSFNGIGPKVADCIVLFGFHRMDSFPVDTWIEKIYREDFSGKETDRNKITMFFLNKFPEYAGIIQQYMFHYKRNVLTEKQHTYDVNAAK